MEQVTPNRLYRSRKDRMIAGVAGGLAEYFNVDPMLVRLAFVVLALTPGVGLLAYIVMAIVVPERPLGADEPIVASVEGNGRGRELVGYFLAALGLMILAGNLGLYRIFDADLVWPVILIGGGVLLLVKRTR